jgi:hypothetical protein
MSELIFILASLVYVVIRTHAFSAMSKSASAKMSRPGQAVEVECGVFWYVCNE